MKTKSGHGQPDTVNQGPAPERKREDSAEFDIGGNVRERGEDPSPGDRERGETAGNEPRGATDR